MIKFERDVDITSTGETAGLCFDSVPPLLTFTFFLVYFSHLIDAFLHPDGQCLWHLHFSFSHPPSFSDGFSDIFATHRLDGTLTFFCLHIR